MPAQNGKVSSERRRSAVIAITVLTVTCITLSKAGVFFRMCFLIRATVGAMHAVNLQHSDWASGFGFPPPSGKTSRRSLQIVVTTECLCAGQTLSTPHLRLSCQECSAAL